MTAIAWQWSWPGLNTPLLVSQEVASVLESYRQKRFEVERGGAAIRRPLKFYRTGTHLGDSLS